MIRSLSTSSSLDTYIILFDDEVGIKKPLAVLTSYELLAMLKESYAMLPSEIKTQIDNL